MMEKNHEIETTLTEVEAIKGALFRVAHAVYTKSNYHINNNLLSELFCEVKDELNFIGAYDEFVEFSNTGAPMRLGFKDVVQKLINDEEGVSMTREKALEAAKKCVCTDREGQYGNPENNFETIAVLWNVYFDVRNKLLTPMDAQDVAVMMALLKIARIATGKPKADNWVDLIGYAACGAEIQCKN